MVQRKKKPVKAPRARRETNEEFLAARTRPLAPFMCGCGRVNCGLVPTLHSPSACRPLTQREAALQGNFMKRAGAVMEKLKKLKLDPPLPPPAPGVEPATAFAERLARTICIFGDPPSGLVIEILKAVRERDAAIVKAKDDERDGC